MLLVLVRPLRIVLGASTDAARFSLSQKWFHSIALQQGCGRCWCVLGATFSIESNFRNEASVLPKYRLKYIQVLICWMMAG